jgi:heat shock protein HtpX
MTNVVNDRPLSNATTFMLLLGATATMLLFYFFVIGSILVLLAILSVEVVVFVAALRFGIGGFIIPIIKGHGSLLVAFCRSMKLGKPPGFRLALKKNDNPELYVTLRNICEKAGVPLPRRVYLEMGVNAWVQMKGFRRGSGTTVLGIGYDLLAGLTRVEFEGVLAHEMMHAKLVERGFRQLLNEGVGRAAKLTNILAAQLAEGRRAKRSENLTSTFMRGADTLTRLAAQQVAACSRQDEFAADRGAAEISSAGAIRSALLKLEDLNRIASRLSLRERVAQLESGEGFSEWLIRELIAPHPTAQPEAKVTVTAFNKYSTHPSLQDRLAALSIFPDQTLEDSPSAIGLLALPDDVAEKLVKAIQKQVVAQEQADSKKLTQWSRKAGASRELQPKQMLGMFVGAAGLIGGICTAAAPGAWAPLGVMASLAVIATGFAMLKYGGYREKVTLPVPDYSLVKAAWQKKLDVKQDEVLKMEEELRKVILEERKRPRRELILVKHSYKALETCDYVRAHVAARLCLELNNKSIPGALAFIVAAGYLKQGPQAMQAIRFVMRNTGMRGESQPWGMGWGLLLLGDWIHAEAFLEQSRIRKPSSATVMALLALSQVRRGKLFSAIASARQAASMQPANKEYIKLLIDLLLQAGFLREANEQLTQLQDEAATDPELMIGMVKLSLMSKHVTVADQWAEFAIQSPAGPHKFVKLGGTYEAARHDEKATELFQHALTLGHYPEALIGLGRLEIHRRNFEQARMHLLAALNLNLPVGEGSANPVELVLPIFQQLKLLQDPILNCRAWIAAMSQLMKPVALANVTLLIYAPTQAEALAYLSAALAAMQPDLPPPAPNAVTWRAAPREQQPDGPVPPGIQGVLN